MSGAARPTPFPAPRAFGFTGRRPWATLPVAVNFRYGNRSGVAQSVGMA